MRRFGPAAVHSVRYRRRPGAYAILARGSEVLVTYQGGIHHEFQLPGGGIDPGEGPIQALHREVLEETGWHISKPKFWRRFRRFGYMPEYDLWAEKICSIYVATPTLQMGAPLEKDHTPIWMTLSDAASCLATSGDRSAVSDFIAFGR